MSAKLCRVTCAHANAGAGAGQVETWNRASRRRRRRRQAAAAPKASTPLPGPLASISIVLLAAANVTVDRRRPGAEGREGAENPLAGWHLNCTLVRAMLLRQLRAIPEHVATRTRPRAPPTTEPIKRLLGIRTMANCAENMHLRCSHKQAAMPGNEPAWLCCWSACGRSAGRQRCRRRLAILDLARVPVNERSL